MIELNDEHDNTDDLFYAEEAIMDDYDDFSRNVKPSRKLDFIKEEKKVQLINSNK
jgi:hypothetical protein